jgi:hypothetical protein
MGLFVLFRISGYYKLKRQTQILRNQGYPVTLEELDRSRSMPQGARNAADIYLRAFSSYVEWDKQTRELLPIVGKAALSGRTQPLGTSTRQLVEKFLSDNEHTLSLLHEAAGVEHCRYKIHFGQPSGPYPPWRDSIRSSAALLSLEALIQCDKPDPNRVLECIRASLALAESVEAPLPSHRLVQSAVRGETCSSIERILNRMPLTNEFLLALSGWLKAYDTDQGYRRALIGEQCRGLHTFQEPILRIVNQVGSDKGSFRLALAFWKMFGIHDREALTYIGVMQDYIGALDLPEDERLLAFDSIQKDVRSRKRGGLLTRKIMPAFAAIHKLESRGLARMRATQAALAIERYRLAEGGLPESLKDIVPTYMESVPTDPFDGRSLKYRTLKTGYVVYSVGDDLADDGGAERDGRDRDSRGRIRPWDVTFIVER